jgi:hypothetical protein
MNPEGPRTCLPTVGVSFQQVQKYEEGTTGARLDDRERTSGSETAS